LSSVNIDPGLGEKGCPRTNEDIAAKKLFNEDEL
jgi:hypothetical protein